MSLRASAVALAFVGGALAPISHAQAPPGRWVATWSTALVGRPQTPPLPGPPGPAPFMASECKPPAPPPSAPPPVTPAPGQTFAPPPFVHFTNQTLRQIVRTSLGGARVRVVLSNAFGTTPLTIGAAHLAPRDQGDAIQSVQRRSAHIQRPAQRHDPVVRHRVQRSRRNGDRAARRTIYRCLPARHHQHAVTADDARRRLSDQLHLRDRQSCRQGEAPDRCDDAKLVPAVTRRGGRPARRRGRRRLRRLDHGRRRVHGRHQPPVAGPARHPIDVLVGRAAWRRQRRHRRQSRAERGRTSAPASTRWRGSRSTRSARPASPTSS